MLAEREEGAELRLPKISDGSLSSISPDEARFNLATHIMSNGVELIIASDKVKTTHASFTSHSGGWIHAATSVPLQQKLLTKPVTLAASTLKNKIILAVPSLAQENFTIPVDDNHFITRNCLTTFTYHSTYLSKGRVAIRTMETVISNRQTEERKYVRSTNPLPLGVTLVSTLDVAEGIFPTTYHFLNSIKSNPYIITSTYTVLNTVTGPRDYISLLQPSEDATPVLDTNTYYSPIANTRTQATGEVTDESIVTQIVVTESLAAGGAHRGTPSSSTESDVQIFATKTYLTTITFQPKATATATVAAVQEGTASNFLRTTVVVNIKTDVVPTSLLRPELVSLLRTELMQNGKNNRKRFVTEATLVNGETLQVTAVKRINEVGFATSPAHCSLCPPHSFEPTTVRAGAQIESTTLEQDYELDKGDQSMENSENKFVSLKPLESLPLPSAMQGSTVESLPLPGPETVQDIMGSFNLHQFRPVLNVVAELLEKSMANRHALAKVNKTRKLVESKLTPDVQPVYIPLKQADLDTVEKGSSVASDPTINRFAVNGLHIQPPRAEADTELIQPNHVIEQVSRLRQQSSPISNRSRFKPISYYRHSMLNNGIPIRPGEVINANADIIIGRPTGSAAQFLRSSGYSNHTTSANLNNPMLPNIRNWSTPPMNMVLAPPPPKMIIPLSAVPANSPNHLKSSRNNYRLNITDFDKILRPPAQGPHLYTSLSSTSSSLLVSPKLVDPFAAPNVATFKEPLAYSNDNNYFSKEQKLILNLNSELNNNEVLEIKPIPQIFSTNLPIVTSYPGSQLLLFPSKVAAVTAHASMHHHTSFKTDVVSQNVYINVPPLTFKKDIDENFPLATAIRGQIATPLAMPTIKVPAHKAYVEVQLSPQYTRRGHINDLSAVPSSNKQIKQNFYGNLVSAVRTSPSPLLHSKASSFPSSSPISSYSGKIISFNAPDPQDQTVFQSNSKSIHPTTSRNVISLQSTETQGTAQVKNVTEGSQYLKKMTGYEGSRLTSTSTEADQKAEYTSYNLDYKLPKRKEPIYEFNPFVSGTRSNYLWPPTAMKNISLGHPFTKPNVTINISNKISTDLPKKLFLAAGGHFSQRAQPTHFASGADHQHTNDVRPSAMFKTNLAAPLPDTTDSELMQGAGIRNTVIGGLEPPLAPKPSAPTHINDDIKIPNALLAVKAKVSPSVTETRVKEDGYPPFRLSASVAMGTVKTPKPLEGSIISEPFPKPSQLASQKFRESTTPISISLSKKDSLNWVKDPSIPTGFTYSATLPTLTEWLTPIADPSMSTSSLFTTRLTSYGDKSILSTTAVHQKQFEIAISPAKLSQSTTSSKRLLHKEKNMSVSTSLNRASLSSGQDLIIFPLSQVPSINSEVASRVVGSFNVRATTSDSTYTLPVLRSVSASETETETESESASVSLSVSVTATKSISNKSRIKNKYFHSTKSAFVNTPGNSEMAQHTLKPAPQKGENWLHQLESSEAIWTMSATKVRSDQIANKVTNKLIDVKSMIKTKSSILKVEASETGPSKLKGGPSYAKAAVRLNITQIPTQTLDTIVRKNVKTVPDEAPTKEHLEKTTERKASVIKPTIPVATTKSMGESGKSGGNSNTDYKSNMKGNFVLDYDSDTSFVTPTRDEEILPPDSSNRVLFSDILLAKPPITLSSSSSTEACFPACKASRNEICTRVTEHISRCECRVGFARLFLDRPCKPIYIFELGIPISRIGSYELKLNDELTSSSWNQTNRYLSSILLDAIDRMLMQSDFRDAYYGVHSKGLTTRKDGSVLGNFLLKLSENSDEKRVENVFKKYLRQSNYSVGGTELYASRKNINSLKVRDFDECSQEMFNDCSAHAHCFNLVGSYTCSCPEGYVDKSQNPMYPGRLCADNLIGCSKCNFQGNCIKPRNDSVVCECFLWHAGSTCQLNLKILVISVIGIGTIFVLLLSCVLLIYMRRKANTTSRTIFITAANYNPNIVSSSGSKSVMSSAVLRRISADQRVILNDSTSESSHSSDPYSYKDSTNACISEQEQTDRSLTVMIPRAKYYHPTIYSHKEFSELTMNKIDNVTISLNGERCYSEKGSLATARAPFQPSLVSAGFEVSAIVNNRGTDCNKRSDERLSTEESGDVRSFDETTVQVVTKSLHLCFENQTASNANDEANTMAERELGSTFLLPHSHLYKPEKV